MSGLIIKLNPRERILINGAVIENGQRRSRFSIITPDVKLLRLRDAIHPNDAKTPVRRLVYAIQLILTGDANLGTVRKEVARGLDELGDILQEQKSQFLLRDARKNFTEEKYYQALKSLRLLMPIEDQMLGVFKE